MKRITRDKPIKNKKEDIFISVEQIEEMYLEIDGDINGFVVWLEGEK